MDTFDSKASLLELQHLIVHQCDEWTDHESGPAACQSRQLVAKRLARAGRHDEQCVFARRDCLADGFLIGPELGEAECALQKLGESSAVREVPWAWEITRIVDLRRGGDRSSFDRRSLTNFANYGTDVLTDAIQKRFQPGFAVMDLFEECLPLAGHRRALHFGMNHFNEMDTLFRCLQVLARANYKAALQQHFDRGRPCGRRAKSRLFYRFGQFSLVQALARCLHRGQECALSKSLRGPGLLFLCFYISDV